MEDRTPLMQALQSNPRPIIEEIAVFQFEPFDDRTRSAIEAGILGRLSKEYPLFTFGWNTRLRIRPETVDAVRYRMLIHVSQRENQLTFSWEETDGSLPITVYGSS